MGMDQIDGKLEQRVWKRVREGESPQEGLQQLVAAEQREAAELLLLSRQFQGHQKELLRKMFQQEQSHGACLRGMHLIIQGKPLAVQTPAPRAEKLTVALQKCYGRKLRTAGEYERRSSDREYGFVFAQMARQEQEHCAALLEILGNLGKQA